MWRSLTLVAATLAASALPLHAQRETERFIPIGRSPGVSGVLSVIGTVEAADSVAGTLRITAPSGTISVRFTKSTDIWLDRSEQKQQAGIGSAADLVAGRRIEVKFVDAQKRDTADWIKVAMPAGSG
jgi:hypothetical protein